MTSPLSTRARLVPTAEPPLERLHDPLLEDLARAGPISRARFAASWSDTASLKGLGERKRAALPRALGEALRAYHHRLGASQASLDALERCARGEAVCAIAGQQPAPLGGPLYTFHKVAATVGMARRFEARTGMPCIPVYWMHGEDSDFDEIRSATIADDALSLHDLALPEDLRVDGGMIGSLPVAALESLEAEALPHWAGHGGVEDARTLLGRARASAADFGEAMSALVLATFAAQGVVVIDPRLPEFRAAARAVIDRYLSRADTLRDAAGRGGDAVEALASRRPLSDATLDSFVFRIEDGRRFKVGAAEAGQLGARALLTPNVALRPAVQDAVLPTVAMAVGPGEAGYLAQLREVFDGLDVVPACPVPRFSATWLPASARELLEASAAEVAELVTSTDAVIKQYAETQVPAAVHELLERSSADTLAGLDAFAERSREVDASLPQMVQSARGKVEYQFRRLHEGVIGKVRHRIEQAHPEWLRLRYYLMPGDRPQERRLASLEPVAHRGLRAAAEVCDLAESHAEALEAGRLEHLVLDL